MKADLLRYSMQIAMLRQLLNLSLISEQEFNTVKNLIMREYGVCSDLTSK
ncbi:SHOCT domain-containing protein [Paenibacillus sp. CAU 1782]